MPAGHGQALSLPPADVMGAHTLQIQTPMSLSWTGFSHVYLNRNGFSPFVPLTPHVGKHILLFCYGHHSVLANGTSPPIAVLVK